MNFIGKTCYWPNYRLIAKIYYSLNGMLFIMWIMCECVLSLISPTRSVEEPLSCILLENNVFLQIHHYELFTAPNQSADFYI